MNDEEIVRLYFAREEAALAETRRKYGAYCMKIAMNILHSAPDSEECVNDTWFAAWRSIPPQQPDRLAAYLGKLTRNFAINRYQKQHAGKRAEGEFAVSLDELGECVSGGDTAESSQLARELGASISDFLRMEKPLERRVFVCRYFYCDSIAEIAARFDLSESRVKSLLFRMRARLKRHLEQGGFSV